jgi:hypothetical protein
VQTTSTAGGYDLLRFLNIVKTRHPAFNREKATPVDQKLVSLKQRKWQFQLDHFLFQ